MSMRKLWLIFAQTVTVSLGAMFVIQMFYPNIYSSQDKTVVVKQAAVTGTAISPSSYSAAAKKAMPAVVNIFTSKKASATPHALEDPLFRHFFGDQDDDTSQRENS